MNGVRILNSCLFSLTIYVYFWLMGQSAFANNIYPPLQFCNSLILFFEFNASSTESGLLVYGDSRESDNIFLQMVVLNDHVVLRTKLVRSTSLTSVIMHRHSTKIATNIWTSAMVFLDQHSLYLSINGKKELVHKLNSDSYLINRFSHYTFIGSIPLQEQYMKGLVYFTALFEPEYKGSIRNVILFNCTTRYYMQEDNSIYKSAYCFPGIMLETENTIRCFCYGIGFKGDKCQIGGLMTNMDGRGFIHNAFPKASISWSTEILVMEFKTKETNVVLFYSGDMNELIQVSQFRSTLIYIDNFGQLTYVYTNLKENVTKTIDFKLKNKYGGVFNDNQWHILKFTRILKKASITYELKISIEEDDVFIYKQSFPTETLFIKTRFLSIGGTSNKNIKLNNFMGCVFKVIYKADNIQLNVLQLTKNKQHGFAEIGGIVVFTKTCQQNIKDSNEISFLKSKSFTILKTKHESFKKYNLVLKFQPQTPSFLLYFHRSVNNENFISIEVRELQLVLGIGYLTQITIWYPLQCVVYIGKVYTFQLEIDYFSTSAKLKFNDIFVENQFHFGLMDFQSDFSVLFSSEIILGGDMFSKTSIKYYPSNVWMASLRKGFKGCLKRVVLNEEVFDLQRSLKSIESKYINQPLNGCFIAGINHTTCQKFFQSPCKNYGYCENNWPNFTCNCDFTNFKGHLCDDAVKPIDFDGSDFIRLDFGTEYYTEVESILIRFRTSYPSVYLFSLIPSDTSEWNSSIQLSLENGLPTLEFQPRYEKQQIFQLSTNVSDGKWHSLIISRNYQSLALNLDGKILQQAILSNETTLSWQQLCVGASLKSADLHYSRPFSPKIWMIKTSLDYSQVIKQNFVGQITKFLINDMDIFEEYLLSNEIDKKLWKVQAQAKISASNLAHIIYPVTFHTHNSYLKMSKLFLSDFFAFQFYFRTTEKSGVLLMASGTTNDFILLELMQGDIHLSFNIESNEQSINSNCDGPCHLADNSWHSVEISFRDSHRNILSLLIDNKIMEEITISKTHKMKKFHLDQLTFVGGLPKQEYDKWRENINSNFGFQGCIAGFSVNKENPINLLQNSLVFIPEHFKNQIDHKCQFSMAICKETHCKNGGQCLQQWEKSFCDCTFTTLNGKYCDKVSPTLTFLRKVATYNYIRFKYQDRPRNTSRDDIAFGLQTKKQDGTILYVESKKRNKGDFMHLYLENGKLVFEYDMGAGIMKLTDHSIKVSDDHYRRVRIRRVGSSAWLQIDNSKSELEPRIANHGRTFNEQTYVWIGAIPSKKYKQFEGLLSGFNFNGIIVSHVLEMKNEFPYLEISSVGDINLNSTSKIRLLKESDLIMAEDDSKKATMITESPESHRNRCKDSKINQCSTKIIETEGSFKHKIITSISFYPLSDSPIVSTTYDGYNILSKYLSKRSLIIIFTCFSIMFVIISFCIICRCCRKRNDRGSYNLTKADKYEQRSSVFDLRPDIQSFMSDQSVSLEKDMVELFPSPNNDKTVQNPTCCLGNDTLLNSENSMQTIATYMPKNKISNQKTKEVKEWYV